MRLKIRDFGSRVATLLLKELIRAGNSSRPIVLRRRVGAAEAGCARFDLQMSFGLQM